MMKIEISDDFDFSKIIDCGQTFRAKRMDDMYRFITSDHVLYIKQLNEHEYDVSCAESEWNDVWYDYFDLGRDYGSIRKKAAGKNDFIDKAIDAGKGIRILSQDAWEMLITFIISQRKSIPAIASSVEKLSRRFGERIDTPYESIYLFPGAADIMGAAEEDLSRCSLGYRTKYVRAAADAVAYRDIDLKACRDMDDDALFEELMKLKGVGKKVANCVMLFGYGRVGRAPVDVWIQRAIEDSGDDNIFDRYGDSAGIVQQYVFYYRRYVYEQMA